MDNIQFIVHNESVLALLNKLYANSKVYGAFIFGSRSRHMETDSSDYDIALFTDLDFFELSEITEDFCPLCDTSDICSLPYNVQEDILYDSDNILFLKEDYIYNWMIHQEYLKSEIEFKREVRGDIYEL